ncbi:hypothetical protein GCM10017711_19690 [Paeniglutamicibacter sulfureus]
MIGIGIPVRQSFSHDESVRSDVDQARPPLRPSPANAKQNEIVPTTTYGGGAAGYTDYPALSQS